MSHPSAYWVGPSRQDLLRSVSENSLVAMDFSGQIGRVIENPAEAQSAALEEGHAWRKRSTRMNILGSQSPLHPSTLSTDFLCNEADNNHENPHHYIL
ncbi:hypothetical protein JD844_002546 [Phrynosoma platyrhinos]|uniref:BPS (Between PH and SH2) domain-containing protein n=1 Tax=Phrynosoma platyrhinos TaxID=52577 RepID=A0ABQ7TBL6_PHRPL|nr:hypothetical protein JD844_002546 [Phrynosoma platyrhinos]